MVKRSSNIICQSADGTRKDVRIELTLSGSPAEGGMHWTSAMFVGDEYVPDFMVSSSVEGFIDRVRMTLGLMRDSILEELHHSFDSDVETFIKEIRNNN